ncbi:MAG TPA: HepT-like ribonuclease domain-containing protein [Thermoanaerobaculia bacterium]|jgi:uncharacterized protein with HEPN domain|nr:HepT-like ribonuclease domain-containing protein [Thermoanaerobaculia bacterium]
MPKSNEEKYVADMLQYAREARQLAAGLTEPDFERNRTLQLALTYLVQIIGEAASRASPATRASLPELPWHDMTSMRNRLVHDYGNVSYAVVWNVVENHLEPLIAALEKITPPEPPSA